MRVTIRSGITTMKAVEVITDPKIATVLVDPMRREIVRLLSEGEKTENKLAGMLGLSDPSVGHHLRLLKENGLIRIVRTESEEHGILSKFYRSNATVYLVDSHTMPQEIDRYFMPITLERARGVMAAASMILKRRAIRLDERDIEQFAKMLSSGMIHASARFSKGWSGTREELLVELHRSALSYVLANPAPLSENVLKLLRAFR
jgi:DNA-binding transcriptional ArsR family regulator